MKKVYSFEFLGTPSNTWEFDMMETREIKIGRSEECEIRIEGYPLVSRVHCSIRFDKETRSLYVIDRSSNGTYIGNQRVSQDNEYLLIRNEMLYLADQTCGFKITSG